MDSTRQVIRWSIPGSVLLLMLSGVYVAMRLYPSFSFAEASAPIKQSLSPVTAVALSVPVGFLCYQLYYWGYSPLRWLGFVSANRGWQVIQCLSDDQRARVATAMIPFVEVADRSLTDAQRELLIANGYGALLTQPLAQPLARMNQRRFFSRLRWLELEPPENGWQDPRLKEALSVLYHNRWWAHRHIAAILLDISTMGAATTDVKVQWAAVSDIYHGLGSTRAAVVFGAVGGILADATKLSTQHSHASWLAAVVGAALVLTITVWLTATLNTVRARTNQSSCNRLGYGLRTTFAQHPELLDMLCDDPDARPVS